MFGQMRRIEQHMKVKRITEWISIVSRPKDRPKSRWKEQAKEDIEAMTLWKCCEDDPEQAKIEE